MGSQPSSVTTTTNTKSEPWKEQKPYLVQGFKEAQKQFEGDQPGFFPGSTVVPFSPESEEALSSMTGQAQDPNSLVNQAGTELQRTLGGEYLSADNPVFQSMMQGMTNAVRPGVDSSYALAGRGGSPGHAEALSRGITQGMLPYIQSERARQYGAVGDALPVSQYSPTLLSSVGAAREGLSRDNLQEELDRFNFGENVESAKLREYIGAITGNFGGQTQSTATQPLFSNPLMESAGAAASIAGPLLGAK